jgi:predicted nucleotidyltransferase
MTKINKPEEIFAEISEDFKNIYGEGLVSIILYGSGAGDDFVPGKSDLNFLVVLPEESIDHLDMALETVARWRKRNVATPLFMTKNYIESSLDSYPLEFLNMQKNHVLVYGEDVLKEISFEARYLRLQCEREIKGKILHLREGFLETAGKHKRINELIKASITAFISIFNGLLCLKGVEIPRTKEDIIRSVANEIPVNGEIFLKCLDIKQGNKNFSSPEIKEIFRTYLMEVRKLWAIVDKMEIKDKEAAE